MPSLAEPWRYAPLTDAFKPYLTPIDEPPPQLSDVFKRHLVPISGPPLQLSDWLKPYLTPITAPPTSPDNPSSLPYIPFDQPASPTSRYPFALSPAASPGVSSDLFAPSPLGATVPPGFASNQSEALPAGQRAVADSSTIFGPAPVPTAAIGSPSQESSLGDVEPPTNNVITGAAPPDGVTGEANDRREVVADDAAREAEPATGAADGPYARSYEQALATIAADPELRAAVAAIENAGDENFRDRLATIIADLRHNRSAGLDAIRGEVFASQMRNRTGMSGAAAVSALATLNAFGRLAALQPELGIEAARESGFRPAANLEQDQRRILWSVASNSNLSPPQKMRRMAEAGLFDTALAGAVIGAIGPAYRGGLLGPADRPGGGQGIGTSGVARTAQMHHAISKKIHEALERHDNLKGVYSIRDRRFLAPAADYEAHRGYQT